MKERGMCRFLIDEALAASVIAAFAHAGLYAEGASDTVKAELRGDLKRRLRGLGNAYRRETPTSGGHVLSIVRLADELSNTHAAILRGNSRGQPRFRIGIAQKALNLYLKYLWCMKVIQRPPHCPFDRIVLDKLAKFVDGDPLEPWIQMDSCAEYRRYVAAAERARKAASFDSLAEWELAVWSNRPR